MRRLPASGIVTGAILLLLSPVARSDAQQLPCTVRYGGQEVSLSDISITGTGVTAPRALPVSYSRFRLSLDLARVRKLTFGGDGKVTAQLHEGAVTGQAAVSDLSLEGPCSLGTFKLALSKATEIEFTEAKLEAFEPPKGYVAEVTDAAGTSLTLYGVKLNGNELGQWRGLAYGDAELTYPFERLRQASVLPPSEKDKPLTVELLLASGQKASGLAKGDSRLTGTTSWGTMEVTLSEVRGVSFRAPIGVEPEVEGEEDKFVETGGPSYSRNLPERGGDRRGRFRAVVTDKGGNAAEVANLAFRSRWTSPGRVDLTADARATAFPLNVNGVVRHIWFSKIDGITAGDEGSELQVRLRDGSVVRGKATALDPLALGAISDCRIVGTLAGANYSLPLASLRSVAFRHHAGESDQPYTLYQDGNYGNKMVVEPLAGEAGQEAVIEDAAGRSLALANHAWLLAKTDVTSWHYGFGYGGPSAATWVCSAAQSLTLGAGEASIEVPLDRLVEMRDIHKSSVPKELVSCRLALADGRELDALVREPKVGFEFHSYRLVGMTPLGLASANLVDLRSIRPARKEAQASWPPPAGRVSIVTDVSGAQSQVCSLGGQWRVQVGSARYGVDLARVKTAQVTAGREGEQPGVRVTALGGGGLDGALMADDQSVLTGETDLGKWSLPVVKVRSVAFGPGEAAPAWQPPTGTAATITDTDSRTWRVYDAAFNGRKSLPVQLGDASLEVELAKLRSVRGIRWREGEKNPSAELLTRDGQTVEGTLKGESTWEFAGATEWGTLNIPLSKVSAVSFEQQ